MNAFDRWRRWIRPLHLLALLLAIVLGRPLLHLAWAAWSDPDAPEWLDGAAVLDDASRLNPAPGARLVRIGSQAPEAQIAAVLAEARSRRLGVSVAGARHSMGGHALARDGIVLDLGALQAMELLEPATAGALPRLRVQAGARWPQVIRFLDAHGLSVAVMQSDQSFSVGGSLGTNVHGWQVRRAPIASTVQALRMVAPSGALLECSRHSDGSLPATPGCELFGLVLGGYGLFGIILEAEMETVPNGWYEVERQRLPAAAAATVFRTAIDGDPAIEMAYGRLSVDATNFLGEAAINLYRRVPRPGVALPVLAGDTLPGLQRAVFRGSVDSDYGKRLRWFVEHHLAPLVFGRHSSRNQLLSSDVAMYSNRRLGRTDILHEYFLPPDRLEAFLQQARMIVPRHRLDLLNVTLRDVRSDRDSRLRYADRDLVAVVMFFDQALTPAAEVSMRDATRELVEAALANGGRYYLPYRPHATPAQFARAYPQAAALFARKRELDPLETLRNGFWDRYGQATSP